MREYPLIIINPKSTLANNVKQFFDVHKIKHIVNYKKENMGNIIKDNLKKGLDSFIICGGDGTVNHFINSYMVLPKKQRDSMKIGFIPCGKANDLSRALNISNDVKSAFNQILKRRIKSIDLIRVNNSYFITGGGLGLPTEIVEDVNRISSTKIGRQLNKRVKDAVYYISVIKKIILGYRGVGPIEIEDHYKGNKRLMLLSVQNQQFIGKRFKLAPDADNSDGLFEVCAIEKPGNIITNLLMIQNIIKGRHLRSANVFEMKGKSLLISTEKLEHFMGDGELLCYANTFKIDIVPHAIKVYY
ncbi:MAG: YegS/Rv2252/BmrU family lipid kinase [Nanoarchaeota archaeon]|nr:YegS/Rv2252/BmrU family lipid kinase [Nanoarchaeota archaeon]MBU1005405.1 YegS/Rv2252/BmrU family lipid kinase [Nanoarchaeota archaeon]MBU1946955.1 YegS/Rv2252/BmrU family lipid kinase [Nanoarchaeota archaeon]